MKILHVNNIANVASILCSEQISSGHTAELIDLKNKFTHSNLLLKLLFSIPVRILKAYQVRQYIKAQQFDLVHVHYVTSALFFIGIKPPLVVHAHGTDARLGKFNLGRQFINWLIYKYSDFILFSTPDLAPYFRNYLGKSQFLPNPIEKAFSVETQIDTGNIEKNKKNIFLYSNLSLIKGAEKSLKALELFKNKHPDAKITILHSGPLFDESFNNLFNVIPLQPRDKLPAILNENSIILGQFHLGAIGMSELEAMINSKPVIAFFEYDKVYPEISPILNAYSTEEIVKQLESIYGNTTAISEIGIASKKWAYRFHASERVNEKLLGVYKLLTQKLK